MRLALSFGGPWTDPFYSLGTSFGYVPRWVAPEPTALRLSAYREGGPLIGPNGDPDGWQMLAPFSVTGKLFESRTVDVEAEVRRSLIGLLITTHTRYSSSSPSL